MTENKLLIFPIDWDIIQRLVIDKIKGLPKDAKIIGITRDNRKETELIGIYSEEFKNIPMGELVPEKMVRPVYNLDNRIIELKYRK